ncbi:MAG: EAL domain-containing protein [Pseudomonadales bacterium]|nr:EAL domain-containing protein [Pseudomonadales bacterium]
MTRKNILLARQPIYDTKLRIYAYELLFRAGHHQHEDAFDGDSATSLVMLNAFSEIGIQNLVADNKAFINFTRNLILTPPPFSSNDVVVEVLETIQPDTEVIEGLKRLKQLGYTIALDDFIYEERLLPLVELADIIKIDVLALTEKELENQVKTLKQYSLKLLAEKVESQEMYNRCKRLGFDFFQGYFLSKPMIVKGRVTPANKVVVMQLIAELQSPETSDPNKLHRTISRDPSLSFKLLRMINSAAFRRPNKVESLYRAILLIGPTNIKHWASLLALTNLDDKPHALHEQTMLRAKMCELLGEKICPEEKYLFFTVGMFSMLDAFFDSPMVDLLNSISLSDEINLALLEQEGLLGFVLKISCAYEQGRWGDIDWKGLSENGLSIEDVKEAYLNSLHWIMAAKGELFDAK